MNYILTIFLLLLSLASFGQQYQGESWAAIKEKKSGNMAIVYYSQPGIIVKESNGQMNGLCVDILNDFATFVQAKYQVNLKFDFKGEEKIFSQFLKIAQTSQNVLCVSNITITPERKSLMKFTPAFLFNPIILLTHKDAPAINSLSDLPVKLQGYSAQVIKGSTHELYMNDIKSKYFPKLVVDYETSGTRIMDNISKDSKLFTLMEITELMYGLKNKLPVKRQNIEVVKEIEQLGFAMHLKSDWAQPWQEFLNGEYKKSIQYKKHVVDNLGEAFYKLAGMR